MRPIRSATALALASVCLAGTLAGCSFGDDDAQATGQIVIGADLELSGAAAATGKAYQRALELKVQQANESGALGGRTIRLDVQDNRSDSSESLRNISEFTNNPAITAIIMGSCNDCAIGAVKTVNDRKIPTIALAAASAVASPAADRRYMFKLGPNAADTAAALAVELKRKRIKDVGLLRTDDGYGREGALALRGELAKLGIETSEMQQVKTTATDVSQAVESLVEPEPDALVLWTSAEQALLAAGSARDAGYTGQFFFDAAAAGSLFLDDATARSVDNASLVFTQTMVIDDVIATTPAKASRKQWFRDYTARYGSYHGFASFAADAVQMIVNAVREADGVDRERLRTVLETSQLDGLSGLIRITPSNHSGLMPQALTMLVARGGRWRLAGG
ncbi:ABC transporter substrate-binding protein [Plantactinospora sp. CA-290183]|uniref:ABC transporter substrate-binding protein n=1 Tax=Plantactinospora sp. CA-290183 TaxID=3240006 RepID=UPI003D93D2E3